MSPGRRTFCHLCKHCTSVRLSKQLDIFFQFLPPCVSTDCFSISSSVLLHLPLLVDDESFFSLSSESFVDDDSTDGDDGGTRMALSKLTSVEAELLEGKFKSSSKLL